MDVQMAMSDGSWSRQLIHIKGFTFGVIHIHGWNAPAPAKNMNTPPLPKDNWGTPPYFPSGPTPKLRVQPTVILP